MQETTADAIIRAYRALLDRNDVPTLRAVHAELVSTRGIGASLRDIAPAVARLRAAAASDPRIDEVVSLFLSLDSVAKREVLRRIREATP